MGVDNMPVVLLRPDRRLKEMRREVNARMHGYVITDKVAGTTVICCQRLNLVAAYISTLGADPVSVASLYESAALGRLVHRRWKVQRTPLEDTAAAFAEARKAAPNAKAVVLSHPVRLTVE